jgi:ligand-binding SRPBCC domain-containing protein
VDEQIKGPYSFWHHRHMFRDLGGTTEMRDVVHYALPAGVLGTLVHTLFIRRRLEQIFRHRSEVIGRILERGGEADAR